MNTSEIIMRKVKPFWGRATVMASPVDEEQLQSGLILPVKLDETHGVKRGVLVDVDRHWDDATPGRLVSDQIRTGMAVYYRNGIQIGDVIVVEMGDIIAYEEEPELGDPE